MKYSYMPYDAPTLICPDTQAPASSGGGGKYPIIQ